MTALSSLLSGNFPRLSPSPPPALLILPPSLT
jgi:hypothetical protein